MLVLVVPCAVCAAAALGNCGTAGESAVILGTGEIAKHTGVVSAEQCCGLCSSRTNADCAAWTWASDASECFLKDNAARVKSQANRISGAVPPTPSFTCASDADCELLGSCTAGRCRCAAGFGGVSCGKLQLAPADAGNAGMVWPLPAQFEARNASSWGFTAVRDPQDGSVHAVVNVGCGATQTKVSGSFMAHLRSSNATAPWELQGAVAPTTSFNPHLVRIGPLFVLYFRVNEIEAEPQAICTGAASNGLPPATPAPYIPACGDVHPADANSTGCVHAGDPENGVNMYVAWAPAMSGPWQTANVSIVGAGALHKSNPSAAALPDGRVLLSYRFNLDGEQVGFAVGETFRGPFRSVSNLSHHGGNDEDSYLWSQPDGSLHVLFHNGPHGYHAFAQGTHGAADNFTFTRSRAASGNAFELDVAWSNGSNTAMHRRERPEILFDSSGTPETLFTAVQLPDGRSYSLAEPFEP